MNQLSMKSQEGPSYLKHSGTTSFSFKIARTSCWMNQLGKTKPLRSFIPEALRHYVIQFQNSQDFMLDDSTRYEKPRRPFIPEALRHYVIQFQNSQDFMLDEPTR